MIVTARSLTPAAAIAVTLLLAGGCATGGTPPVQADAPPRSAGTSRDALQQCVMREARAADFSGVVSISRPGGAVIAPFGQMAGPGSPAMQSDAQFSIGSAGKMWTAVAIAQLVDAGRIGLDDPVGRHLGGLTPEASEVTVRQLLTHSGGMGNFFAPENMPAMEAARSLGELKPLIAGERPAFAPGSRSQYSNSGFLILGLLIEAVSGQSYASYLQDKVFAPAGMTRSGMLPASGGVRATGMTNLPEEMDGPAGPPQGLSPGVAGPRQPPAAPPSGGPRMGPPPGGPAGPAGAGGPMGPMPRGPLRPAEEAVLMGTSAGGGYATPPDMQRFFAALHGGRLVSPAMLQALTSPQVELLPARGPTMPAVHYGLGFGLGTVGSHAWSGHGGGAPGLNVATASFPADQTTLVVMSNRDPPAADMLARRLQAVLFDGAACGGG